MRLIQSTHFRLSKAWILKKAFKKIGRKISQKLSHLRCQKKSTCAVKRLVCKGLFGSVLHLFMIIIPCLGWKLLQSSRSVSKDIWDWKFELVAQTEEYWEVFGWLTNYWHHSSGNQMLFGHFCTRNRWQYSSTHLDLCFFARNSPQNRWQYFSTHLDLCFLLELCSPWK